MQRLCKPVETRSKYQYLTMDTMWRLLFENEIKDNLYAITIFTRRTLPTPSGTPKNDLVKWTGGNVSARDPETGYVVIKPSGVRYEVLKPADMVVVDLDGNVIEGDLKPSSDTASHLYIYRQRPDVGGVVHTHSPYATAFAAVGKPIPVYLTAMADEFGGPIPCGGFALIGSEAIGKVVVESIGDSCAVLLKNHGVFTVGANATAASKPP